MKSDFNGRLVDLSVRARGNRSLYSPAIGTPAIGTPAIGTPAIGTPAIGTPAIGTPPGGGQLENDSNGCKDFDTASGAAKE